MGYPRRKSNWIPIEYPHWIPIESPLNTNWQFGVHGKWNNGYPLKPIEIKTNWSPLKPIGFNRDLLVSMGTNWFQWVPMLPIGFIGDQLVSFQLVSIGTHCFTFHVLQIANWYSIGIQLVLNKVSMGNFQLPIGINGDILYPVSPKHTSDAG